MFGEPDVGEVGRVDAGHDQAGELARGGGFEDLVGVAAGLARQYPGFQAPGAGQFRAGAGVADEPAAGQQVGQAADLDGAAVAGPAGYPCQPRTGLGGERRGRGQPTRYRRQPLADEQDRVFGPQRGPQRGVVGQQDGLATGYHRADRRADLAQAGRGERRDGVHRQPALGVRLAQPQEEDRALLLRLQPDDHHGGRGLDVGVAHVPPAHHVGGEERRLLFRQWPGAEVDVVRTEDHAGELRVRVGVLGGQPAAGEYPHAQRVLRGPQPLGGPGQRLRPGSLAQYPGPVLDHRRGDPVEGGGVLEAPPALVAVPLLVDLGVVTGQAPHDLAAPPVGAHVAAGRAVLARAGRGHQVERPRAEPVLGAGQRADRADLHGVAGEVGLELVAGEDVDLLGGRAVHQVDERVAGDLLGEPGAALAQYAPLAVEQYLRRDVDRLLVGALDVVEPGIGTPGGHRLVLQGALAALVTHRAVEGVVDQEELHDPLLRLPRDLGRELGLDDHAVGYRLGTGGDRLALALDLDEALPAGPGRREQRVVAEARDGDTEPLGDPDHQFALGGPDLDAVDGQGNLVTPLGYVGHECAP